MANGQSLAKKSEVLGQDGRRRAESQRDQGRMAYWDIGNGVLE